MFVPAQGEGGAFSSASEARASYSATFLDESGVVFFVLAAFKVFGSE